MQAYRSTTGYASINSKLQHLPGQTLLPLPAPLFELWKISLFRFPPPIGQNCVQMPLPIFHVKDRISYGDFLHIDQALKPRPGRPFF